jgi:hypothetical protein
MGKLQGGGRMVLLLDSSIRRRDIRFGMPFANHGSGAIIARLMHPLHLQIQWDIGERCCIAVILQLVIFD